jgi:hypothetical protein
LREGRFVREAMKGIKREWVGKREFGRKMKEKIVMRR